MSMKAKAAPLYLTELTEKDIRRFWSKVSKTPSCWLWLDKPSDKYGVFGFSGKVRLAHRISYLLVHGQIDENLSIDHLCKNRMCVNPLHLELVTWSENSRRGHVDREVTHCPKGHEYTSENTYIQRNSRQCKACTRERKQRYRATRNAHLQANEDLRRAHLDHRNATDRARRAAFRMSR